MKCARRLIHSAAFGALLCAVSARPAMAAGGAHVVDDANVETPGMCHLESWSTRYGDGETLFNLAPACTRLDWPKLEIGAAVTATSADGGDVVLGPAMKLNLRAPDEGVGVALIGSAGYSPNAHRMRSASLIAPVTFSLGEALTLNLNAGWSYLETAGQRHALFTGAQLEMQPTRDIEFMIETFVREGDHAGMQTGVRWTPHQGRVDPDFLAGRYTDGVKPNALTLGITVRR